VGSMRDITIRMAARWRRRVLLSRIALLRLKRKRRLSRHCSPTVGYPLAALGSLNLVIERRDGRQLGVRMTNGLLLVLHPEKT
jgi:hypothetical protein